jgi:4'-phosphopantetheinyl transferase EntD
VSPSSAALLAQLRLPAFVAFSTGILQDDLPRLSSAEQASIGPMTQERFAEFSYGRMHARLALAKLGCTDASITVANDRSPLWPSGVVGSISHVPTDRLQRYCGQVVAVAARKSDCSGLGVDLERTDRLQPEQWPIFMTDSELELLCLLCVDQRSAFVHGVWSAKEASMKALCQPQEPQSIEIRVLEDGRSFTAQCRVSAGAGLLEKVSLRGSLAWVDGWVAAFAIR